MKSYTLKTLIIGILLLIISALFLYWFDRTSTGLSEKIQKAKSVSNFEQCAALKYPIQESFPRICRVPGGKSFVEQEQPAPTSSSLIPPMESGSSGHVGASCKNLCGDDRCEQVVCSAVGCPCAESAQNCPQDCFK